MRCIKVIIAVLWLLPLACTAADDSPADHGLLDELYIPATQPADTHGLVLQVKPERDVITAGDALVLTLTVQNRGQKTAAVWYEGYQLPQYLEVYTPKGKMAPLTNFRRHTLSNLTDHLGKSLTRKLHPGMQTSSQPRLSACFDLTEPGRYRIRASVDVSVSGVREPFPLNAETFVEVRLPDSAAYSPAEPILKDGDEPQRSQTAPGKSK